MISPSNESSPDASGDLGDFIDAALHSQAREFAPRPAPDTVAEIFRALVGSCIRVRYLSNHESRGSIGDLLAVVEGAGTVWLLLDKETNIIDSKPTLVNLSSVTSLSPFDDEKKEKQFIKIVKTMSEQSR